MSKEYKLKADVVDALLSLPVGKVDMIAAAPVASRPTLPVDLGPKVAPT